MSSLSAKIASHARSVELLQKMIRFRHFISCKSINLQGALQGTFLNVLHLVVWYSNSPIYATTGLGQMAKCSVRLLLYTQRIKAKPRDQKSSPPLRVRLRREGCFGGCGPKTAFQNRSMASRQGIRDMVRRTIRRTQTPQAAVSCTPSCGRPGVGKS